MLPHKLYHPSPTSQTDTKPIRNRQHGLDSVLIFGFEKLSVACPIYVGVVSILSGNLCGRVGFHSATDGTWFVGLHRSCIEHLSADMSLIQDQFKTEPSPT